MPLIRFAVGSGPRSVAVAPDGRHVYVTLVNENTVSVIDTTLNAVVTTIPVGSGPVDVAVAPDGRHVYVTVINENTVSVIDTSLNAVVTTIPVPDPFHLAVAPDGRHVYVSHGQLNRVSVIDTTLNAVVTTIQAGARPATTTTLAVAPDGRHVYVSLASQTVDANAVLVIDTTTNAVVTTIPVGGIGPIIAVAPDGRYLYVANAPDESARVSVIDTTLNAVVTTIPVASTVSSVAVAPDGGRVYVTLFNERTVSVINTAANAVVTTIPVGSDPADVAVSAENIYVINEGSDSLSVLSVSDVPVSLLVLMEFGYDAGGWRVERHPRFLADLTGDGRADIVGFANEGVFVALNNGNGTFQQPRLALSEFGYDAGGWRVERHPRFLADLTGDGRADIVGFANEGVIVALNNGNGTFQPRGLVLSEFGYDAGGWRVERHPRFLADLTGDGRADIVGFANEGVIVALNNGNGTFQQPRLALSEFGYDAGGWRVERHPRFLADLTGDGRADIVGFANEGVFVALNNGNGTFQQPRLALSEFGYDAGGWRVERHPRFLADLTGDGRADIVGFANEGVIVALNNGNGTFQQPRLALSEFGYDAGGWRVELHPRFLADLTGDGRADIVGFEYEGVFVALNNGDGTFQPPQLVLREFGYDAGGWRVERHPRFLADLTGDGRAEIVGFANEGVFVALNNGGTF